LAASEGVDDVIIVEDAEGIIDDAGEGSIDDDEANADVGDADIKGKLFLKKVS
jgi:hypothetical protein